LNKTNNRTIPKFISALISEKIVLAIIFLNAFVFLSLDINPKIVSSYPWLEQVDIICVCYFILEAILKIYSLGIKEYINDHWNKFDLIIVISSLPILLEPLIPDLANNLSWTPILRMTRIFRLAKFLRLGRLMRYAGRDGALSEFRVSIYLILLIVTVNFLLSLIELPKHIETVIDISYGPLLILASVAILSKILLIAQNIFLTPYLENEYGDGAEAIGDITRTIVAVLTWIIGLIIAIEFAGFNSFSLFAGLGIGSIAVAFAAQDLLGNLLSGAALFSQKHFVIGDYIKIGNYEGKVSTLGLRSFVLESSDGSKIAIPNKIINTEPIHNLSIREKLNGEISLQLSTSLKSEELNASIQIIKEVSNNFPLINNCRINIDEMKFTHNISITYIVNINDINKLLPELDLMNIVPTVGRKLYMKIFEDLEKSNLTPENTVLFVQN
tara:strand:+ start:4041 stop:5366 length:1326 start_codon:yes stop_codon:yes gene_type:complete